MKKILVMLLAVFCITTAFSDTIYFLPETQFEAMPSKSRGNVPARIDALLKDLQATDKDIKDNFDSTGRIIHKSWYLNSEFEKDRNIMVSLLREIMDGLSNLDDRLQSLELELFNPDELGFNGMYNDLRKARSAVNSCYKNLNIGKSGIKKARNDFAEAKIAYARITENLVRVVQTIQNAVPYNPPTQQPQQPNPQPTINYNRLEVRIVKEKIKTYNYDIVNSNSYEGKLVLKKSKERLHELSSIDKLLYKKALRGQDGLSYAIVKNGDHDYTVFWWHIGDDIGGIIDDIEDIFD